MKYGEKEREKERNMVPERGGGGAVKKQSPVPQKNNSKRLSSMKYGEKERKKKRETGDKTNRKFKTTKAIKR